jgi:hypothetical protein
MKIKRVRAIDVLPTIQQVEIIPVEMVRGFMDNTWDTFMMNVPKSAFSSHADLVDKATRLCAADHPDKEIAFFTVYNIGEPEWVDPSNYKNTMEDD